MKHEQSFNTLDTDVREWLPNIRKHLTEIDADSGMTKDDKKLLKRFYLENCLPPRIQDVIRKFFPDEFAGNERQARSRQRAKTGDRSASDPASPSHAESEPESVAVPSDADNH